MSNEGKGYPNPPAKHPISSRLESVREKFGVKSKRAFHRRLSDGWKDSVSYEAVRNYHYDREPPPSYLARVAEVFDVRLAWLVAGKGAMTEEEEKVERGMAGEGGETNPYDQLLEEIPKLKELDTPVRAALLNYMHRWVRAHMRADEETTIQEALDHAASVWEWMHGPLNEWAEKLGKELPLHRGGASDYFMVMLHALNLSLQVAVPPGVDREQIESWPDLEEVEPST